MLIMLTPGSIVEQSHITVHIETEWIMTCDQPYNMVHSLELPIEYTQSATCSLVQ